MGPFVLHICCQSSVPRGDGLRSLYLTKIVRVGKEVTALGAFMVDSNIMSIHIINVFLTLSAPIVSLLVMVIKIFAGREVYTSIITVVVV